MNKLLPALLLLSGLLLLYGTVAGCTATPAPKDALYQRLGGTEGITRIVDNLLYEISQDEKVLPLFADTDIDRFREKLIEQLANISGGNVAYTGDNMAETHRGLNITDARFNSLVEDLIRAMEAENIPTGTQNALLARLVPMYGDIIGKKR